MPTKQRVLDLVRYVEQGKIVEALNEFYGDDVVMRDNNNPPVVGRSANVERERAFFGSITVTQMRAQAVIVDGDRAAVHWLFEFVAADGTPFRMDQISIQRWSGDRVVDERFYYDSASIVVKAAAAA